MAGPSAATARRLLPLAAVLLFALLAGTVAAYEARAPIKVFSDAEFAAAGFPGSGTAEDPYVIEGYEIAATAATGIYVKGTTAHFVIRDCKVAGGGGSNDGIRLEGVKNGLVEDVQLEANRHGLTLVSTTDTTVRRVHANSTSVGFYLDASSRNTFADNDLPHNERDVHLKASTGNTFTDNRLSIASKQFGFYFEDEASYDNAIPTSNTVNGVPVRWYANADGATVEAPSVTLTGITNVAQIMVYSSVGVTIHDPVARDGAAKGIEVLHSDDVRVVNPVAKGNAGDGFSVRTSDGVDVVGGNVSLNGDAGFRVSKSSSDVRIEHANVTLNRGKGVVVSETSSKIALASSLVLGNEGDGVWADRPGTELALTSNTVRANGGHGVYVTQTATGASVRDNDVLRNKHKGMWFDRLGASAVVAGNEVADNTGDGVTIVKAKFQARFADNVVADSPKGFVLVESSKNTFHGNTVRIDEGDTGFHFSDTYSYDNQIPPNNTVNGVAMRWYVAVAGTADAPLRYEGLNVGLEGITNVAQILFHNASRVVLEAPVARNGTAVGLYLHQTSHATVDAASVRDNDGDGVKILAPTNPEALAASNTVSNGVVEGNGGHGIHVYGVGTNGNVLRANTVRDNGGAGLRFERVGASNQAVSNTVKDNAGDGIALQQATLVTLRSNAVSGSANGVSFGSSTRNALEGNTVALEKDGFGLYFKDEASYDNDVATNNTVDGVNVRWYAYTNSGGSEDVTLPEMGVHLKGITNVAQIMLYKVEHVVLPKAAATSGTARGIYLYKSSFVTVHNATATGNPVGIALLGTSSSTLADNDVGSNPVGVQLETSSRNTIVRTRAEGAGEAVVLKSGDANRVWATDATGVASKSVSDPSFKAGSPNSGSNFVVDAGLDKRVLEGTAVTFDAAIAVSPFKDERILSQTWQLPKSSALVQENANVFRPTKWYNDTGEWTVTFTVRTTGGNYSDTVKLEVVEPLGPPEKLRASAGDSSVVLFWREPEELGISPVTSWKVYRAEGVGAFALLGTATTERSFVDLGVKSGSNYTYAVSALNAQGEGPRSSNVTVSFWSAAQRDAFVPTPPVGLNATVGDDRDVKLAWDAPLRAGSRVTYVVARAEEGGDFEEVAGTVNRTYVDRVPLEGGNFTYRVTAENVTGTSEPAEVRVHVPPASVRFEDLAPASGGLALPNAAVGVTVNVSGVRSPGLVLVLDGEDVSARLTIDGDRLAFLPPEHLAAGPHAVNVTVLAGDDVLGNVTWTFEVKEPTVACPFDPVNGTVGFPMEFRCSVSGEGAEGAWTIPIRHEGKAVANVTVDLVAGQASLLTHEHVPTAPGTSTFRVGRAIVVAEVRGVVPEEEAESPLPLAWPLLTLAAAAALRRPR